MDEIAFPERSAAFFICTDRIAQHSCHYLWNDGNAVKGGSNEGKIAFRHGGKAFVIYYDGHVGAITLADLKKSTAKAPRM